MIPVPVRVLVGCALMLWGTWTIGDLAFTVALLILAALFLALGVIEAWPDR